MRGIEPLYSAWEADVLPLNYTRLNHTRPGADLINYPLPPCKVSRAAVTGVYRPILARPARPAQADRPTKAGLAWAMQAA